MEAYCVKCRAKREMSNAKAITMKNGKPAEASEEARQVFVASGMSTDGDIALGGGISGQEAE